MERIKLRAIKITLFVVIIFALSGCTLIGNTIEKACSLIPNQINQAHCYQEAAMAQNDPDECAKIPQSPEFQKTRFNSPKDKCYYSIALNARDPQLCQKIEGGVLSYNVDECIRLVLEKGEKEISQQLKNVKDKNTLPEEEKLKIWKHLAIFSEFKEKMEIALKAQHEANMVLMENLR